MRPTVGRIVNYHSEFDGTVQAAIIAHVWSDNCVNLSVLDLNGIPRGVTSVVQGTDKRQWEWPDYYTKTLCSAKQEEPVCERMLDISEEKGAKANISDLKTYGDTDTFLLLCKASSDKQGFMKSTKVCNVEGGCIVQVTTQQRNPDGSYSVAEALTYVPGVHIDKELSPRRLVTTYKK